MGSRGRSDEAYFHESWLGMVQQDGLVLAAPVLTAAGVMARQGAGAQRRYRGLFDSSSSSTFSSKSEDAAASAQEEPAPGDGRPTTPLVLPDLSALFLKLLGFRPGDLDFSEELPPELHVVAADAALSVVLRPTAAIRREPRARPSAAPGAAADEDDPFAADDPFEDTSANRTRDRDREKTAPSDPAPRPDLEPKNDPERSEAARAGADYLALIWDLTDPDTGFGPAAIGRDLDRPDREVTWSYPPAAKFERLLRHARIPIGLLTNRTHLRLIYAPHGESVGALTFDFSDLGEVDGRPMLDALLALLSRDRWLTQAEEHRLPALLAASRRQQAEVTEALADQVFDALTTLLTAFEAAARRDGRAQFLIEHVREASLRATGEVYAGLLTVLLRLVFLLYAEDRGLLPIDHPIYQGSYSLLGLFDELQADAGAHPDAMDRRFGAWSRLLATFRAIYAGADHDGDRHNPDARPLRMPPRRGHLFDPDRYPFLEGRDRRRSIAYAHETIASRAAVRVPSIDDGAILKILDDLLYLRGGDARQRLSYRALDVEEIGSVYEALMGYDVICLGRPAVRLRARRAKGVWLGPHDLLAVAPAQRAKWLKDQVGLDKGAATKLAREFSDLVNTWEPGQKTRKPRALVPPGDLSPDRQDALLDLLVTHAGGRAYGQRAAAGRLVIQPGEERRRTSSHYTPRELTEPLVRRTLTPLLRTMEVESGQPPGSEALLSLKIVDPAMGSGAFLVEVVRQLADHVVTAWQREGRYTDQGPLLAAGLHGLSPEARPAVGDTAEADPLVAARRLVAQRCVYGVDKNPYAVDLAKLSLWLVTMSRGLPFTFVDHALRRGDSLVGLDLAQLRAFDWKIRGDRDRSGDTDGAGQDGKQVKKRGKKGKKSQEDDPGVADPLLAPIVAGALKRATTLRQRIVALALDDSEAAVRQREELLREASAALDQARLTADLCLGAFFNSGGDRDRDREAERTRRFDQLLAWLGEREGGDHAAAAAREAELRDLRRVLVGEEFAKRDVQFSGNIWPEKGKLSDLSGSGAGPAAGQGSAGPLAGEAPGQPEPEPKALETIVQVPFHWMLEFPEVFWDGRVDPLVASARGTGGGASSGRAGGRGAAAGAGRPTAAYFDAVVGNPPFMGGRQLSGAFSDAYLDWLKVIHPGAHGNADLCAHFFRRAEHLLGPHGVIGLVATNTIGQGDTRSTGLQALLAAGLRIYDATADLPWPAPGATVTVSLVHLAAGSTRGHCGRPILRSVDPDSDSTSKSKSTSDSTRDHALRAQEVAVINSRLAPRPERADPVGLTSNDGFSFQGSIVLGMGFILTPEERDALIARDPANAAILKPYLGGAEVNRNPDQGFDRYVIDFGDRSLEECGQWPELLAIVRSKVKPERDKHKRTRHREHWWCFADHRPGLYADLAGLSRCLVTSRVTKHLCFSWQPTDRVLSEALVAIAAEGPSALAVLQSRVHERWARALGSSMETRLRYTPSDCFRNFPFPAPDPRTEHPPLKELGERLDALRSEVMVAHGIGLTALYNLLLGLDDGHAAGGPSADPRIARLRDLHLDLDRAVLATYATQLAASPRSEERDLAPLFAAIEVPPYSDPRLPDLPQPTRQALDTFNDAVLDALMALNQARAPRRP